MHNFSRLYCGVLLVLAVTSGHARADEQLRGSLLRRTGDGYQTNHRRSSYYNHAYDGYEQTIAVELQQKVYATKSLSKLANRIHGSFRGGLLTLTGNVDSEYEKRCIEELGKQFWQVREVDNCLQVHKKVPPYARGLPPKQVWLQ